jgi:hypothetical protein
VEKWVEVLTNHYRRQERAIVSRVPKALRLRLRQAQPTQQDRQQEQPTQQKVDIGGVWFDVQRWNDELFADLLKLNLLTATAWAERMVEQTGEAVSMDRMRPWLEEHARISAEGTNEQMRVALEAALNEPEALDAVKNVFAVAIGAWALRQAVSGVTAASNFGANEAANAARLTSKTWRTNSGNPRDTHAALSGVTIPIGDRFSTGQRWPGDPAGGAENNANCECSVDFS